MLSAQPFDVAKTILQAYVVPDPQEEFQERSNPRGRDSSYSAYSEDGDENEVC